MVDLQKLVQDLINLADLTEVQIADELGVSQPTVNRLKNGKVARPAYHVGAALIALHKERVKRGRAA